jgi:hypothetical protein
LVPPGVIAQKNDPVVPLLDGDIVVSDPGFGLGQFSQLVVMGGKQGLDPPALQVVQILGHGPGDAQTIVGAGAASDLIHDHQAVSRGIVEVLAVFPSHHEGNTAGDCQGADAVNAIGDGDIGLGGGTKGLSGP